MIKTIQALVLSYCLLSYAQSFEWAYIAPIGISTNPFYYRTTVSTDTGGNPVYSVLINSRYNSSLNYYGDVELVKRDPGGNVIWTKLVSGKVDISRIVIDKQNNIICAGSFKDTLILDQNNFLIGTSISPQSFLFKMDENGNTLWLKDLQQLFQSFYRISSAAIDNIGNIWVTAYNFGNSTIYKFDTNGNLVSAIEQTNVREAGDLSIDNNGNIWVTGAASGFISQSFNGFDTIPPFSYNEYVVKYSADGTAQWIVFIEDITFQHFKIVTDNFGYAYLAGNLNASTWFGNIQANGPSWVYSYFLTRIDPTGNFIWLRETPVSDPLGDASIGNSNFLHYNENGYVYVTGFMRNHLNYGNGIVLNSFGSYDALILKYSVDGNLRWAVNAGSAWMDEGSSVSTDKYGNCYVAGRVSQNPTFGNISLGGDELNHFITKIIDSDVVPVELISFSASTNGNNVNLNWSTATETNNSGFEIERSVISNEERKLYWDKVGFVNGNGTTTESRSYLFTDDNLTSGKYSYRLKQIDFDNTYEYSNTIEVDILAPDKFSLEQNYPNPFNPVTKIRYTVPNGTLSEVEVSHILLTVYDILGNQIAVLVDEEQSAGIYEVEFDASSAGGLSSGMYFYKLSMNNNFLSETKKMILLK